MIVFINRGTSVQNPQHYCPHNGDAQTGPPVFVANLKFQFFGQQGTFDHANIDTSWASELHMRIPKYWEGASLGVPEKRRHGSPTINLRPRDMALQNKEPLGLSV